MAVERRVKPSARARQALAEKKKVILIAVLALVAVVAVIVFAVTILPSIIYNEPMPWETGEHNDPGPAQSDRVPVENPDAIKAMLEQTVSYYGTWIENPGLGFQVYLPGTELFEHNGQTSNVMYKNSGGTAVYGIIEGNELPTLNDDATVDANAVMEATVMRITNDVSQALYGAQFSASYDVSTTQLGDRTPAIVVTGDLQTVIGLQDENTGNVEKATYNFPLCGIGFVRNNIPVMIWGVVDSDDAGEAYRLPTYMEECARIISSVTVDNNGEG